MDFVYDGDNKNSILEILQLQFMMMIRISLDGMGIV